MLGTAATIDAILNVLSAIFAMLAAGKWLEASLIKIPPHTSDSYDGKGPFTDALTKQSSMNATAAKYAAIGAILQTVALSLKVFGMYYAAYLALPH